MATSPTEDDELYKHVLQKAHRRFISDLDPTSLLDAFIETDFLATTVIRDIEELETTSKKNRTILDKVSQSGMQKYQLFKKCLDTSHQGHLKEHLIELEKQVKAAQSRNRSEGLSVNKPMGTQKPPHDIDRSPSNNELQAISEAIGSSWEHLASALGISLATVDHIKMDHGRSVDQILYMLYTWKQKDDHLATLRRLFKAMKDVRAVTIDWDAIRERLGFGIDVLDTQEIVSKVLYSRSHQLDTSVKQPTSENVEKVGQDTTKDETQSQGIQAKGFEQPTRGHRSASPRSGNDGLLSKVVEHPDIRENTQHAYDVTDAKGTFTDPVQMPNLPGYKSTAMDTDHEHPLSERKQQLSDRTFNQIPSESDNDVSPSSDMDTSVSSQESIIVGELKSIINKFDRSKKTNSPTNERQGIQPQSDQVLAADHAEQRKSDEKAAQRRLEKLFMGCHEGRLINLNKEDVDDIKRFCDKVIKTGGFGDVHISTKSPLPGLELKVALKEIHAVDNKTQKLRSVTCERMAARIMHFGICPVLACWEKEDRSLSHLLSPYLEGGDLITAIKGDNIIEKKNKENKNDTPVRLNYQVRLRILYHIAAAIDYLHTNVTTIRGGILHRDLKSANIVLDQACNARIIDFGLARELSKDGRLQITESEVCGSPGYCQTSVLLSKVINKTHDYFSFGVVIREMMTGQNPWHEKKEKRLCQWNSKIIPHFKCKLWDTNEDAMESFRGLCKLSEDCLESTKNTKPISSRKIKDDILGILAATPNHLRWRKDDATAGKCQICMINKAVPVEQMTTGHTRDCTSNIQVCVACMRNFYINPIKCHSCDGDIRPPVGAGWGALLISGNDLNRDNAQSFKKEILDLQTVLVSKCPPVMCISESMVEVVCPENPGTETEMIPKLNDACDKLGQSGLSTLVLVFSGHYFVEKGFQLGSDKEYITVIDLQKKLEGIKGVKRILIFLDCCNVPKIEMPEGVAIAQLSACAPSEQISREYTENMNSFTQFIRQALTRKALRESCLNAPKGKDECPDCVLKGNFVTVHTLQQYVENHAKRNKEINGKRQMTNSLIYMSETTFKDAIVAFKYDFAVGVDLTVAVGGIPKSVVKNIQPNSLNNIDDLKISIFQDEILAKGHFWTNLCVDDWYNVLCIEYDTGPKPADKEEIASLEGLMLAWNAKVSSLRVSLRDISDLNEGNKVGLLLRNAPEKFKLSTQICNSETPHRKIEVTDRYVRLTLKDTDSLMECDIDTDTMLALADRIHEVAIMFALTTNHIKQPAEHGYGVQLTDESLFDTKTNSTGGAEGRNDDIVNVGCPTTNLEVDKESIVQDFVCFEIVP